MRVRHFRRRSADANHAMTSIRRELSRSASYLASGVSSSTIANGVVFVGDSLSVAGTMKPEQMTPAGRPGRCAGQLCIRSAAAAAAAVTAALTASSKPHQ